MARVMLIEDHEDVQIVLREFLEQAGHTVRLARLGRDAMDDIRALEYDLLITDVVLPLVSGWDLIEHARKLRGDLPIIAISGGAPSLSAEAALRLSTLKGADGVLEKPFRRDQLLHMVAALLQPDARPI